MTSHLPEVEAIRAIPSVDAMLEEVCRITGMGFAAVAHVTSERWVACDEIRASGKAVFIDEVASDPHWRRHHTPALYGFKSYVSVPIVLEDGRFFGTLCAIDPARSSVTLSTVLPQIEAHAREIARALSNRDGHG